MTGEALLLLVVAVALIAAASVVGVFLSRRRSARLRSQFGPEYDHAVAARGDRRSAEDDLEARRRRVEELELRELTPQERTALTGRWEAVQAGFVDRPEEAVLEADRLLAQAMADRGYPRDHIQDGGRREEDLSVGYPAEISHYREAAVIADRSRRGEATTEELRRAMVHYRSLFESLVGAPAHAVPTAEVHQPAGVAR
jgi:hypothetical protein